MTDSFASTLGGVRVLDLTEDRGLYAGKLMADLGADVVKIERPEGGNARRTGPFKGDAPGIENSLYHINFNTNKRGVTLNLGSPTGRDIFKRLIGRADVVIEDFAPGVMAGLGLDYSSLQALNHGLVMASITGFGQTGPYSGYKVPDVVSFAMGGLTYVNGAREEPPVVAPCEQSYHSASITTAFGIVTALFWRMRTGEGQYIDASTHEVLARFNGGIQRYSQNSDIDHRSGSQFGGVPGRIYPCKDGYVHILAIRQNHWQTMRELMGNPEMLMGDEWLDGSFRARNVDLIDPYIIEFTMAHTKMEITLLCQGKGIPCTPVNTPADFAQDAHVKQRGFITEIEHPVVGRHSYLSSPYRFSQTPCRISRAAPLLGQHNKEIYEGELGYTDAEIDQLKTIGVI